MAVTSPATSGGTAMIARGSAKNVASDASPKMIDTNTIAAIIGMIDINCHGAIIPATYDPPTHNTITKAVGTPKSPRKGSARTNAA